MTTRDFKEKDVTIQSVPDFHTESLADLYSGDFEKKLGGLTLWSGSQAAYDAITTKNPTTLYFITGV